ncbi:hypothetical protein [Parendozoicomonas haliclonae]|uniref:Uncharacterized protein n=1 Tax=Parendozoicomonas haliclonae TaxID=1960125 RepID=A0A1X7AP53_9GAMM|nr:hypothetical protein [Parendozoicomonas haliclonae]SMA50066.1 hypothetical protein EHSB41UT_03857 [Parendozoicomonas haliclonae]
MIAFTLQSGVLPFAFALVLALVVVSARAEPVRFQNIEALMVRFAQAELFRKKAPTLGRLPAPGEVGMLLPTKVSDGQGGAVQETINYIREDHVIARNPEPVVPGVYNEWLVKKVDWLESYGALPTSNRTFKPFTRKAVIRAILIDDEVLRLLGSEDGETALIHVGWSPEGMRVFRNGYLTRSGYGIAPEEMEETYRRVPAAH